MKSDRIAQEMKKKGIEIAVQEKARGLPGIKIEDETRIETEIVTGTETEIRTEIRIGVRAQMEDGETEKRRGRVIHAGIGIEPSREKRRDREGERTVGAIALGEEIIEKEGKRIKKSKARMLIRILFTCNSVVNSFCINDVFAIEGLGFLRNRLFYFQASDKVINLCCS